MSEEVLLLLVLLLLVLVVLLVVLLLLGSGRNLAIYLIIIPKRNSFTITVYINCFPPKQYKTANKNLTYSSSY